MSPAVAARVRCPAKINLGLWIIARRPDGFHEIDTILQTVTLEDELLVRRGGRGFTLECAGLPLPGGEPNLVERAFDLVRGKFGNPKPGFQVRLTKRIPVGGGLGGGSSDAAGFLAASNELLGLRLSEDDLERLGSELGSDVPFFIRGGTARATGRGDQVRHVCPVPPCWIVLATPPVAISTSWAYGLVRKHLTVRQSGATMLEAAAVRGCWTAVATSLHNDFEDVVLPAVPSIAELRRAFVASGALGSLLSGSGSTVFGLAGSRDEAEVIAERVGGRSARIHVVRTRERGVTLTLLA